MRQDTEHQQPPLITANGAATQVLFAVRFAFSSSLACKYVPVSATSMTRTICLHSHPSLQAVPESLRQLCALPFHYFGSRCSVCCVYGQVEALNMVRSLSVNAHTLCQSGIHMRWRSRCSHTQCVPLRGRQHVLSVAINSPYTA